MLLCGSVLQPNVVHTCLSSVKRGDMDSVCQPLCDCANCITQLSQVGRGWTQLMTVTGSWDTLNQYRCCVSPVPMMLICGMYRAAPMLSVGATVTTAVTVRPPLPTDTWVASSGVPPPPCTGTSLTA